MFKDPIINKRMPPPHTPPGRSDLFLQFFFTGLLGLRGRRVGRAVGTNIILQPIHRLRWQETRTNEIERESVIVCLLMCFKVINLNRKVCHQGWGGRTFLVLWGFFILDDFFMSTSVVFTHPGCENSSILLIRLKFHHYGFSCVFFALWQENTKRQRFNFASSFSK